MVEYTSFVTTQLILLVCLLIATPARSETGSPRVVTTKYGKIRGIIRPLNNRNLRSVEVFLGIPYATPPTGTNRFSPTRSPNSWAGERFASQYGAVCPQQFPDSWNSNFESEVPKSFVQFIKKMHNHLSHQNEDCLYLNVYVPSLVADTVGHKALPVMVFIHGGDYQWGGSNPYDGSVFAAHAEVIVVTLNYRLGPLGFLNTNADPSKRGHVMNHGLMDQIAALHWIQESIGAFGGDPGSITLLGHGTGAACVQFLMVSAAVVPGLFHRAILMSGSALSSWATVDTPIYYAVKFGEALKCTGNLASLTENEDGDLKPSNDQMDAMVNCLKDKPLEELNSVNISAPQFLHAFAPSVDGIVIKSDYQSEIHNLAEESKVEYDLLFGVVTQESYNDFSQSELVEGFSADRRDRIFRTLIRNMYDYHLNEVFISVVNEYTDWDKSIVSAIDVRDSTIEALSDARHVGPLVRTSKNLKASQKRQYFYVFNYTSDSREEPVKWGAAHGDELPYLFGAPLVQEIGVYEGNWTDTDQLVSEAMLTYFGNFVKTGNPNTPRKQRSMSSSSYRRKYEKDEWHKYDSVYQKYMLIGNKAEAKDHYRAHCLALWTWLIPQLQKVGKLEFTTLNDDSPSAANSSKKNLQELSILHHLFTNHDDPSLYSGRVRPANHMAGHYVMPPTTSTVDPPSTPQSGSAPHSIRPNSPIISPNTTVLAEATMAEHAVKYVSYSTALSVTIAIGASILILNILIIAGVYYKRDKARMGKKSEQHSQQTSQSSSEDHMPTITGVGGPLINPGVKDAKKQKAMSPTSQTIPKTTDLDSLINFPHISTCPPAFADTTRTETITTVHCSGTGSTLPNGRATQISSGMTMSCPPPPRLFSSESQPLLPITVPSPPKSQIPNYDDMRV